MPKATVSGKGWVVIPKEIREKYRLRKGDKVLFVDYGGIIALVPASSNPIRESRGLLKGGPSLTEALLVAKKQDARRGNLFQALAPPPPDGPRPPA